MTAGRSGSLLRRNASFRFLWTSRSVSYLGESLGLVALLVYLEGRGGAALGAAMLLLAIDFVPGLFGPVAGAIADRFDLRRVLICCEVSQAALTAIVALTLPGLVPLLVLVAIRRFAAQIYLPASRSAVPLLVDDEDVESANSTLGAGTYGLEAAGPLVAAALFPLLGVQGVLAVTAMTYAAAAFILVPLPGLAPGADGEHPGIVAATRAGFGYLWATPTVRVIALGFFAVVVFSGVDDVALVFLAKDTLAASDAAAAALYAGVGIGLAVGYPLLARYGSRFAMLPLLVIGFAVSSLGNLLTGLASAVVAALLIQVVRGLGLSALDVALNTYLQRTVPQNVLGRVFGTLYGLVGVAAGISYLLGGVLLQLTDARTTFVVAGGGGLLVTVATGYALRRTLNRRD
ncbi:MFS transporter [Antrihabitans sp. YC2-6]|uniref:MFS transporter n=1 Tax=Antrihabitans sp. YC2-6 TaxID=2799498 RepID=UPI0018F440C9|nr:MFS transporter [Antrihabitans sp. YC2-6]MBJ8344563.1 MFS transporter [Antrihabitans sp. YC2-6]